MSSGFVRAARALAVCASIVTGVAAAAPKTLPLSYTHLDGDATVQISGSVTFDDSIWTPNQNIFQSPTGLIAVSIKVSGPSVPGGTTTFTIANVPNWAFTTDSQNRIIDMNFFGNANASGCFVYGFEVFMLGFYCGDPEDEGDYVSLKLLQLQLPAPAVPSLDPSLLALLMLLMAATAAAALRRRR
jgi:hypothetical protein